MSEALNPSALRVAVVVAGLALVLGALAGMHPNYAVGMAALALVTLLAFVMPVTHMTILIALTTLVPYSFEGRYHLGGSGANTGGGLQASDVFLLTGLIRSALIMPRLRLTRRQMVVAVLVVLTVAFTAYQGYRGLQAGVGLSEVGAEFRGLGGGFAFALIAMCVLSERGAHRRTTIALALLGLALGLEGIAQWTFGASFGGDFGVRAGVSLTTGGEGQLQGGLFAFPIAVLLATSVLVSGTLANRRQRWFTVAILLVNTISLLLTFERTFWVATGAAVLLIILRSGRARRARALLTVTASVVIGITILAAVAPGTLQTAEQRLVSIGQYQTDNSVRYRTVESSFVLAKIRARPLMGWGLGDTIFWGQPWDQVPPSAQSYTHVGYLWLFWHAGLIGGAMFLLLLALSAVWPGRPRAGGLVGALRIGAQASVVALLIVNFTFPAFHQGSQITYMMGFLIAYCALPVLPRTRSAPAYARVSAPVPAPA